MGNGSSRADDGLERTLEELGETELVRLCQKTAPAFAAIATLAIADSEIIAVHGRPCTDPAVILAIKNCSDAIRDAAAAFPVDSLRKAERAFQKISVLVEHHAPTINVDANPLSKLLRAASNTIVNALDAIAVWHFGRTPPPPSDAPVSLASMNELKSLAAELANSSAISERVFAHKAATLLASARMGMKSAKAVEAMNARNAELRGSKKKAERQAVALFKKLCKADPNRQTKSIIAEVCKAVGRKERTVYDYLKAAGVTKKSTAKRKPRNAER